METVAHFFYNLFVKSGMTDSAAHFLNTAILLVLALIIIFLVDFIVRKLIRVIATRVARRSKTNFDDLMITNKVPRNIAHIIPLFLAVEFNPLVFADFETAEKYVDTGLKVFGIVLALWIARSLLNTLKDYFKTLNHLKDKPIDSYIQVFMIFAWLIGLVSIFGIITGVKLSVFFATIGTASAIIILVFRDTILGFVASIQVSINDMVRIGDWVTFEKYGADGDVIEINLATVKVQNFDKTITTIPTYALISDSFRNWRGMMDSSGRRIKRSLIIKQDSVRFVTNEDLDRYKKIQLVADYIKNRQAVIDSHNAEHGIDKSLAINGRNMTNLGLFRNYMQTYLEEHSAINKDMLIMARQLEPSPQGIPLQIYAFSRDKRWQNYEYITADIFDHLIAAVPYFDLQLFELPSDSSFGS